MNKTNKSIVKNYSYNLIFQVISIIVPIITTPYVSRIISPEGMGLFSYTQSICSYFTLTSIIGTDIYGQREIAYCRDDVEKRSIVFWEIYIVRVIGILLCSVIYLIFACQFNGIMRDLLLIRIVSVFGNVFNIVFLLQGVENFKTLLIRNIIVKLLSVICIFIFVKQEDDLKKYVIITIASVILGNMTLWANLRKYIKFVNVLKLKLWRHIKTSFALFIPTIALRLYDTFDKTMMGTILDTTVENGYYEQALKLITIAITVVTSLGNVMLPRVAFLYASKDKKQIQNYIYKSFNIVWLLSLPIAFGLVGISDNMVPWFFGNKYADVANLLKWFAFICIPMGLKNVIGMQYLIPTNQQKKYTISILIGLGTNIILNIFLIPKFEAVGAVIASIISEIVIVIIQYLMVRDIFSITELIKMAPKKIIASMIMLISLLFLSNKLTPSMFHTLFLIGIGLVGYFIFMFIMKDSLLMEVYNNIKTRKSKR